MLFIDHIVLVDETRKEITTKVEKWSKALNLKDLEIVEQK